jgi:hypothetical protein
VSDVTGPVEAAVNRSLDELEQVSAVHDALGETARSLARSLDRRALLSSGQDGLASAALARELRATLELLAKGEGDGDNDAVNKLLERFSAPVSSAVRDSKD